MITQIWFLSHLQSVLMLSSFWTHRCWSLLQNTSCLYLSFFSLSVFTMYFFLPCFPTTCNSSRSPFAPAGPIEANQPHLLLHSHLIGCPVTHLLWRGLRSSEHLETCFLLFLLLHSDLPTAPFSTALL